jgi:hypothetical protein
MSTPGPGVRAACEALRADAAKWQTAADALQAASGTAAGLTLLDKLGAIPQLAGGKSLEGYDQFRQKMTTALGMGAAVFGDLSTILKQVADVFEREDIEGAHRVAQAGADK